MPKHFCVNRMAAARQHVHTAHGGRQAYHAKLLGKQSGPLAIVLERLPLENDLPKA